jgi:hypothetical protein
MKRFAIVLAALLAPLLIGTSIASADSYFHLVAGNTSHGHYVYYYNYYYAGTSSNWIQDYSSQTLYGTATNRVTVTFAKRSNVSGNWSYVASQTWTNQSVGTVHRDNYSSHWSTPQSNSRCWVDYSGGGDAGFDYQVW